MVLKKLKSVFSATSGGRDEDEGPDPVQAAVAVLLAEIAQADHEHDAAEEDEIRAQLAAHFALTDEAVAELARAARETVAESVSLHDFTRTLHENMSYAEKQAVIEMMWRIALADRNLDKYEDYMIAKIGELLYVYRADVLRIKHSVSDDLLGRES